MGLLLGLLRGIAVGMLLVVSAAASPTPRVGTATYYGRAFHGRRTATGERFDMNRSSCASRHASYFRRTLRVTNLANGRVLVLRCNDRGGRGILDLSKAAMKAIGGRGTARVRVEVVR